MCRYPVSVSITSDWFVPIVFIFKNVQKIIETKTALRSGTSLKQGVYRSLKMSTGKGVKVVKHVFAKGAATFAMFCDVQLLLIQERQ